MDPLHLTIALVPLAVYLLVLGIVNLARRPFLTTGARDMGALAVGVAGFVVVGPMELFLPEAAAIRFSGYIWGLLLILYALGVLLLVLLMRPRLVIYNATTEQIRPVLSNIAGRLDQDSRWAGDSLVMPRLGVQLTMESAGSMRNVQLVSAGSMQSYVGWRRLERELAAAIQDIPVRSNPYAASLIGISVLLIAAVVYRMTTDMSQVAQALHEMLRL